MEGEFPWLFECGVGTDFCRPHVSWHSLPPKGELAYSLFGQPDRPARVASAFANSLAESPAECGRVVFENIEASAPSLGPVAVSATWAEVMKFVATEQQSCSGSAYLWSPLLPHFRE